MGAIGPAEYLSRTPEQLVIQGYRHWTRGFALGSPEPWYEAESLYRRALGSRMGERSILALADFVKVAGLCSRCPLAMLKPGACALCYDEALVLGLISGLQHSDDPTTELCLHELSPAVFADRVAGSAAVYALTLKAAGKLLLPIPAHIVAAISQRKRSTTPAQRPHPTVH